MIFALYIVDVWLQSDICSFFCACSDENAQYSDVRLVAEVARKYPKLKLVCCHCFYPEIEKYQLLVEYPNVYFDISSVADDATILNRITIEVKRLIEVAPNRVLFGSDYSGCSQKDHIQFIKEMGLSEKEEKSVFEENAVQVYSLRR